MTTRKMMIAAAVGLTIILAGLASAQSTGTEDIYISASGSGTAGSVSFADEDIVLCDRSGGPGTCIWDLFFDGSAKGVGKSADLTAFHVVDDDNILLAFKTPKRIGNLKKVDDSDIVHFDRAANPNNAYSYFFDGSDVGLTTDDESIDAMGFDETGRLVISTDGDYSVPLTGGGVLSGGDEDLIVFNGTTGSSNTSGDFQLFFDGSSVGLNSPQEDVWGTWVDNNTNEVYVTTRGDYSVGSLTGIGTDIFICDPLNFDPITACATISAFFVAAAEDFDDKIIDGIFVFNNDPPDITSGGGGPTAAVDVDENTTAVTDVESIDDSDAEGAGLTYSLTGGADVAKFSLDATTGVLAFLVPPDFEDPTDSDTDNDYEVQVTVTDSGGLTDSQDITVTVININEPPEITSDGGGDTAAIGIDENTTAVTDVETTDPEDSEGSGLTYSLTGGADSALFSIDANSGVLAFISAPDFEDPADDGLDNVYDVQVTVTDSGPGAPLTDAQDIAVSVNNVNEAPEITSDGGGDTAAIGIDENTTAVTDVQSTDDSDAEGAGLTYSITGGADSALFSLDASTGVLAFLAAPDFENPTDAGGDNVYDVQVTVTDSGPGTPLTDVQDIAVTVNNVNDGPPEITSDGGGDTAAVSVDENTTAVTDVESTDPDDAEGAGLTYSLTGGADSALFSIDVNTGVLAFLAVPDFEAPADAGLDNVYDVQVTVTDSGPGAPLSDTQDIAVTVDNVNEAPEITSNGGGDTAAVSIDENTTAVTDVETTDPEDSEGSGLTYSLTGGADSALFSIDANTGVLAFITAPDFENPGDAGLDNVYDVQVTVTDSGPGPSLTDVQDIAVTVLDVAVENEAPEITTSATPSAAENQTAVIDIETTDDNDSEGAGLTYSITGGADSALFSLDASTGVLAFLAAPDFENPADAGLDNVYNVQVTVTDSGPGAPLSDVQDIAVSVTNVNEAPVAVQDDYTGAIGNTLFALVAAPSGSTPVPPTVELVGDIVSNDTDVDVGDTLTVTANPSIPTTQGGTAAVDANGRFVYTPPAGFPGSGVNADSFTYEVCDDGAGPLCANGTVTIEGADMVWYVDDSSPNNPGTGTAADPFRDLSSAGGPSLAGETIFVYAGTQTTGITLKNSQPLLGEGVALVVSSIPLVDAGTRPVIANAGGAAITLGSGNTVRGLDITGSQQGIVGSAFGTLTADTVAISTTGGDAIDLSSGVGAVTFDSVSSSASAASGIDLDSISGSFNLGSGSISGSTGDAVEITGSTATISYGGTIAAGSALAVDVSGHSANSVSLSGAISSTGQGISLSGNTGGTINLSGGMSLSTGAFSALSATGGGTLNVTGTNTVETTSATAVNITDTAIGGSGVTFESIDSTSASANVGIILDNTGSGTFDVTGTGGTCAVGAAICTGGRIANKTGDAVTLNDTGGRVTLTAMLIEDIGSTGGGFNTRSQHDAIHGEDVLGGLTLDNMLIRRVSDMCVNGATFGGAFPGVGETTWDGLDIVDSTIEDCNRFHVANVADTQDEGGVRIAGLTGDVMIDNNTFLRTGEHLDLFTHSSGTLNLDVSNNFFIDAYQEYSSPFPSGVVSVGGFCVDVTVEGSSNANVTIGGAGDSNDFENCGIGSIRVSKDTAPAGSSNVDVIVDNNTFRVTDQTDATGTFGNTPQGGVLLRAGPGAVTTFDGIVSNNTFGIAIGPDDRIGSTTDEIANADGVEGNVALIFESGVSQARVNNNTFNGSINAPWVNRADGNTSAAVLYQDNSYRGRDDYCCDSGFMFTVPGIPYRTQSRNGGDLDITFINDQMVHHDQFFFAGTETLEFLTRNDSGFPGGTMCMAFDGAAAGDGYEFKETSGTLELYQGAVNNAATGPCAPPHGTDCEAEMADDGVRGGASNHAGTGGTPTIGLNPPHVDVDGANSISIIGTPCTLPTGGIF